MDPEAYCSQDLNFGKQCEPVSQFCGDAGFNPRFGYASFDNVFVALLILLQSMSLEGWSDHMDIVCFSLSFVLQLCCVKVAPLLLFSSPSQQ